MNTVAIIQARMGSTRLPGKALRELRGKPMLLHVVERVRQSKLVDMAVVATTDGRNDDAIEKLCAFNSIECFRGSENDVLDRYYRAAIRYGAEAIVRITADCPFIDPEVTGKVISVYLDNKPSFDGATNAVKRTYPRGLDTEVFSFPALEKAHGEAKDPGVREHVTMYMYQHPEEFSFFDVLNEEDLSGMRWTVDEEADFELARQVYASLYNEDKIFLTGDILRLVRERPELLEINRSVKQKGIL